MKNMSNNVLITGATGFVGAAVINRLLRTDMCLKAAVLENESTSSLPQEVHHVVTPPLSENCDFSDALNNVDIVIHLAARVHIMQDNAADPLQEFRRVNVHGTERLARQAVEAGVKRFVFISTNGVNGNSSGSRAFTEEDKPAPHNPYSESKLEAEACLRDICANAGMALVIIRPTLVYGAGVKANFLQLIRSVNSGVPLPLATIRNKRSLIYVENLADAIACCVTNPVAAGQTYFVSDGEDVSTPELIRRIAFALGRPARLFPFPMKVMRIAGKMLGKSLVVERVLGSLQVDGSKIRRELGWVPPYTMKEGLRATAEWFKKQ